MKVGESMQELFDIYKRNFLNNIREEKKVKEILSNENNYIIEKRENDKLIAVSVINNNTILMLCVDNNYRNKGIGAKLLKKSEEYVINKGYDKINIGAGFDYLLPGVPMTQENITFFTKRGYYHSWGSDECFDMDMELNDFKHLEHNIGDKINDIYYRFATIDDMDNIIKCAISACIYQDEKFDKYYNSPSLYNEKNNQRVLIGLKNKEVVGAIIISIETEGENIGSVGCTCVRAEYMHQKIGTNMVMLGTKYLRDIGLKYGHLGYTYTGLDKMYGYSGYKITTKYMMAEKKF